MGSVTGYTKERMKAIEDGTIVEGLVSGDDLILTRHDGTIINAGNVRGPKGDSLTSGSVSPTVMELLSPIGAMQPFGGASAPTGWLICDGSSQLITTYPALYAAIGAAYGSVDPTHFNLPDLRLRVPIGKTNSGTGSLLGSAGGSKDAVTVIHSHSFTTSVGGNHAHATDANNGYKYLGSTEVLMLQDGAFSGHYATPMTFSSSVTSTNGSHAHTGPTDGAGFSGVDANLQPYVVVNWIIRY